MLQIGLPNIEREVRLSTLDGRLVKRPLPSRPALLPGSFGQQIRLADILGSLSYALDLTEGQPAGHAMRCAWIGMQLGRVLGLRSKALSDLYYTLLLKDAGCSSNAARLWELYGGDERLVKRDFKTVDSQSTLALGRFVLQHTGPGEPLRRRVQRLFNVARHGDDYATEVIQTRCDRGAQIALSLGFGQAVADGVHALDEHWNGKGRPSGLAGTSIPLASRIALVAQVVDVFNAVGGPAAARTEIARRSGTWFDPAIAEAFRVVSLDYGFWAGLADDGLSERVVLLEPVAHVLLADEDRMDAITDAFAEVIDAKSRFTAGHSRRVMRYADAIAAGLGVAPARRRWLRRAALLHDIGKLGVGTGVLDKPGRLDAAEWDAMQRHTRMGDGILRRVSAFADMAEIANTHHERLDGKGYPHGRTGNEIGLETRIVTTSDIFDAITAKRPYRDPMPLPEAVATMESDRGTALDGRCLDTLWRALPALGFGALDVAKPTPDFPHAAAA